MADLLGWAATAVMTLAALMVAANAGARITGWGFVLFTASSLAWTAVAVLTGVTSLAIANGLMIAINAFGVWRWLGRQARIEAGSALAEERSRAAPVPTLVSAAGLIGTELRDCAGASCGTLADLMLRGDRQQLAYAVISVETGAAAAVSLRALAPVELDLGSGEPRCLISADRLELREALDESAWPLAVPRGG